MGLKSHSFSTELPQLTYDGRGAKSQKTVKNVCTEVVISVCKLFSSKFLNSLCSFKYIYIYAFKRHMLKKILNS